MTKEELAATLNGRQYREETTGDEEKAAHAAGLVVVFGASDDLMEMRGAVDDENGSVTAYFTRDGILSNECDNDDCPHFARLRKAAAPVQPVWDEEGYSWIYKTDIPHATFEILEDGDKYCRGIVFALADVP